MLALEHADGAAVATEAAVLEEGEYGKAEMQRVVWYERRAWEGEEVE